MQHFTPISALIGGALIGLSASMMLLFNGRIAGVSGIVGGLLQPSRGEAPWRAAFLAGLLAGGLLLALVHPRALPSPAAAPSLGLVAAGLLVGFGTRLGNGCTSGHGVCGLSRLSFRSLVATAIFMGAAVATVFVVRHLLGGGP